MTSYQVGLSNDSIALSTTDDPDLWCCKKVYRSVHLQSIPCGAEVITTNVCITEPLHPCPKTSDLSMLDALTTTPVFIFNMTCVQWVESVMIHNKKHII